jgi:hypothetical protein
MERVSASQWDMQLANKVVSFKQLENKVMRAEKTTAPTELTRVGTTCGVLLVTVIGTVF